MTRSAADMALLAARAKTKVKATARGWSLLSRKEIEALAFIADLMLEDTALPTALAKPEPVIFSEL